MPRVSVIVPAYNCANFILLTLHFALRQTFSDLEIVIVNDGSSDNLLDIIDSFGANRIRVIAQTNAGMSAARNRGIRESDSEFVALLDADDIWHPKKIEVQVEALAAHSEMGLCFSEFRVWNDGEPVKFEGRPVASNIASDLTGWVYHRFIQTCWALPSTLTWRRSVNQRIGNFLEENNQTDDWEFMIRASREFQFVKLADTLTLYRQHPSQLSKRLSDTDVTAEMREKMLRQYGYFGPDGSPVDLADLAARRYRASVSFGTAHLARGKITTGLRHLAQALVQRPLSPEPYAAAVKSLAKRRLLRALQP